MKLFTIISLTTLFINCSLFGFSQKQKIKIKDDIVTVNNKPIFKLENNLRLQQVTLSNLQNEKLAIFKFYVYHDSQKITPGNPQGTVSYYEVTFLNKAMDKCELSSMGRKGLAKIIVELKLVEEGALNEAAIKQMVAINGMHYSEERERSHTIIIKTK